MERLMQYCNNYFERTSEYGKYTVSRTGNAIEAVRGRYCAGQYIRIMDSFFNDGVYKIKQVKGNMLILDKQLSDEVFNGYVVGLAVPSLFIDLAQKVNAYDTKASKHAGVASESIPNYSVTFDSRNKSGVDYYSVAVANYKKPPMPRFYFLKRVIIYE